MNSNLKPILPHGVSGSIILASFIMFCSCGNRADRISTGKSSGEIITDCSYTRVETESGLVAGYLEDGIYIFKGIPYAEAERFMPPHKVEKWEGIRSSRAYGPVCPQGKRMGWYSDEQAFAFDWDDGYADENCLRLNIWTRNMNSRSKRPVMVWLHGGGYAAGSGQELPSYDGAELARKGDVVVISLNHRLNVLGFLDLSAYGEKYAMSGNAGMLDIVAALEWIQENVEKFGGDPSNVTIFGQSGGGGKVSTLMAMPAASGLFHKAIVQSGSILETMEATYSRKIGTAVMEELHLMPARIDDLQKVPYEKLLEAGNRAIERVKKEAVKNGFSSFIFGWAPTVDGEVLPYQPDDSPSLELSGGIPLLLGTTLHEFTASTYNPSLRNISMDSARAAIGLKYGDKTRDFLAAFENAYPEYRPSDLFDVDFIFRSAAIHHASVRSSLHRTPVYMYLFTWESPVMDGILRSTHCMELPFVFNNIYRCNKMTGGGEDAHMLADRMSSAWLNFAETGDPNSVYLPQWEPYTTESGATMIFDTDCELRFHHDKELMEIMNSFPFKGF